MGACRSVVAAVVEGLAQSWRVGLLPADQEVTWPGAGGTSSDIAYPDPRGYVLLPRCTGASHQGFYRPRAVRSAR